MLDGRLQVPPIAIQKGQAACMRQMPSMMCNKAFLPMAIPARLIKRGWCETHHADWWLTLYAKLIGLVACKRAMKLMKDACGASWVCLG